MGKGYSWLTRARTLALPLTLYFTRYAAPELLEAIAAAAVPRLPEFVPQGLANTAWAYATAGHPAPTLFKAIAAAAPSRLDDFKPQELANTAWAYAKSGHPAPELLDEIAASAVPSP